MDPITAFSVYVFMSGIGFSVLYYHQDRHARQVYHHLQ